MRYEQEVDTRLAMLLEEQSLLERDLRYAENSVHDVAGDKYDFTKAGQPWIKSTDQCIAILLREPDRWHRGIGAKSALARFKETLAVWRAKDAEVKAQEALFTGWSRFFLVRNVDGHIHSSMHCSTCNWKTDFGWLPDVSGLSEKEAVEAHGKRLCTICFPSAPTDWCEGYRDQTKVAVEARRTARAEAKAAKEAKKAAYWSERHFGVRHTRPDWDSDWVSGCENEWEVKRGARPKGLTRKAALKSAKDYSGYNGTAVAIDLLTGEVVDA